MTYQDILKDLKKKNYLPVYCLHGQESYFIDLLTNYFETKILSEGEKSFNQMIMYGKDTDAKTLIDTCSRYPMMAPRQVVILKEAQDMKGLADLQAYMEKPVPTTILVICHKYKKLDGRSKLAKTIAKTGLVFESKKLYDNQVPDWIEGYLTKQGFNVDPGVSILIAEYLGTELSKIVNEVEKLSINLKKGTTVTTKHVQEQIGISKEYNVFELQNALSEKDTTKVNRIVQHFVANPKKNPLVMVTGSLYNFFSKVYAAYFLTGKSDLDLAVGLGMKRPKNEYAAAFLVSRYRKAMKLYRRHQTEHAISILKEYDLKSKGVDSNNTPQGELLREMIFKILT